MKKLIYRNIAIVSAIFIVTFSIMLVTNYFQVRGANPLETGVMDILRELNDVNANNPELQAQIRELDLLARRAYFAKHDRLASGVFILLLMVGVFVFCARGYFEGIKDIPDKEIDPVDEWANKTRARKYLIWGTSGLAATALVFVLLTSPHLRASEKVDDAIAEISQEFETQEFETEDYETVDLETPDSELQDGETEDAEPQPSTSRVNHNFFRGANSNGHSSARNIPVSWNVTTGQNIAWRRALPREGTSSPVVNGNRVFVTVADNEARELLCFDLNNGNLLWTHAATNIPGSPAQMPETAYGTTLAAPTVATNGTHVCAIFGSGDLVCTDMNGNRVWARGFGLPDNHYGYASSLLMYGNLLFVQYDNRSNPRIMAFDIATGAERWSRTRRERINWTSPIIAYTSANRPILVLMGTPNMTAYNLNNGEELWSVNFLMGEVGASAASANGIVFGASDNARMVAVNADDGAELWRDNFFLPEVSSPVATRDNVYIATTYGVFAAFNAQTGELRKEHELVEEFYSSPMIVDGKIYLFDETGKMHIFSTDNEFTLLHSFETGEGVWATPAFVDGTIVVRSEKSLYVVRAR